MHDININTEVVFKIQDAAEFEKICMSIFNFQIKNNPIYCKYATTILKGKEPKNITEIPFLPIELFKTKKIICNGKTKEKIFLSSGTTGKKSQHLVSNSNIYIQSITKCFEKFYGSITDYCFLALLPSYNEQESSSLIYMADMLIKKSNHPQSNYYINNYKELSTIIKELEQAKQPTILLGVTYALLDFAKKYPQQLDNTIIIETGGMKGKRKELIKEEIHDILKKSFNIKTIHSEYGMTELLSQSYSKGNNIFKSPSWMKILILDINDPLSIIGHNQTGGINIIDLANIYSCPFIATQDIGKTFDNNTFSVLGRFSYADIRGCNLLVE